MGGHRIGGGKEPPGVCLGAWVDASRQGLCWDPPRRLGGYLQGDFIREVSPGEKRAGFTVLKTPDSQYTAPKEDI